MAEHHITDWFAWFIATAFFGIIVLLAVVGLSPTGSEAVLILVGTASGGFTAVISYRYGTTQGSERKSEQITSLAHTAAVTASTAAAVQAATTSTPVDPIRVDATVDLTSKTPEGAQEDP